MFGMTRREQWWKAEQKLLETIVQATLTAKKIEAGAELQKLRAENETLRADLARLTLIRQ